MNKTLSKPSNHILNVESGCSRINARSLKKTEIDQESLHDALFALQTTFDATSRTHRIVTAHPHGLFQHMQHASTSPLQYGLDIISVNASVATKNEDTLAATETSLKKPKVMLVLANLAIESTAEEDHTRLARLEGILGQLTTKNPNLYVAMLYQALPTEVDNPNILAAPPLVESALAA